MKRLNRFYLLIVFGLMILTPLLNGRFHFVEFKRLDENRRYHDSLSININQLDKFPKGCELYLRDNFAFRTPMIQWARAMKVNWFKVSPDPEHLIIGKHGRYFIAGKERSNYEGDHRFTTQQLDSFEGEWLKRKRYLAAKGIAFKLIMAPSALEAYPEDLPINIVKRYPESRADQLRARLNKVIPGMAVDPKPAFEKAKKTDNLYFRLDNHWNAKAGMIVSRLVLEQLERERFPQLDLSYLDRYTWGSKKTEVGYLASLMPGQGLYEYIPIPVNRSIQAEEAEKYNFPVPSYFMYPQDYEIRFVNKKPKNKLKLLIIRDSFGDAIYPVMKEAFAETVVIFDSWEYRLNKAIIEAYKPDVVVFVTYDPYLESYINPKNWE